jgi:hypothetical protein
MYLCMATKTISVDLEAYARLRSARQTRDESFSMVIKRAVWPEPPRTAGALLEALAVIPRMDAATLDRLEQAQRDDRAPEDPWRDASPSTRRS